VGDTVEVWKRKVGGALAREESPDEAGGCCTRGEEEIRARVAVTVRRCWRKRRGRRTVEEAIPGTDTVVGRARRFGQHWGRGPGVEALGTPRAVVRAIVGWRARGIAAVGTRVKEPAIHGKGGTAAAWEEGTAATESKDCWGEKRHGEERVGQGAGCAREAATKAATAAAAEVGSRRGGSRGGRCKPEEGEQVREEGGDTEAN
jgi:hypothetical protein